ncbi:MAG: ATP-dependent Clp protease ATP-binding subunit [Phaeodactylibacter sp.]|nr:ATP-dependent Clp protease ATP-binding subunit [Phaeodactylibacter sp.]
MAYKFSIPFYAFRLHLHPGVSLLSPLADNTVLRIGQTLRTVASQYANTLQQKVLNTGQFHTLLDEYQQGDFLRNTLLVRFPAAKDGISYPAFQLEFEYFFNQKGKSIWGLLPALNLEAFAEEEEALKKRLEDAVFLEFSRHKRLQSVQDIVSAIWFESIELQQQEIQLEAPNPMEMEDLAQQGQEKLLPRVAKLLEVKSPAAYGREKELNQFVRALKGRFTHNVLLVGPSGVGKTALAWELARQQKKRRMKEQIWETTASTLIKELMEETGWQENLSQLCKELSGSDNILFIRSLMELFEVGKYEGNSVSIADYFRPFLSRGEVVLISECTEEELARIELQSPSYISYFTQIHLKEPEGEVLEAIILDKVKDTAQLKSVRIEEEAIREAIRLNRRFSPYSGMPGKPIRSLESLLINKRSTLDKAAESLHISRSEVIHQFCEETGMPRFMADPAIPMDTVAIKADFNSKIFGQEAAVDSIVDLLAAVKTALTRTGKPIASLLLVGPTGVGKTELAKTLAEFMFGNRNRLVRFDMSEFSTPYSILRLTGTSYFTDGLLTSAIRREPFSVLLFDEIEKADPHFFDLLLQLLSEGRLTDNQGKLANFCSTIIIMTSNIGAQNLSQNPIGWTQEPEKEQVKAHFLSEAQKYFRPELFNRIDQVIPFAPLDKFTVRFVIEREVQLLRQREGIRFRRMNLQIEDPVLDFLAEKGYDSKYGARQLQRTIRDKLLVPLAKVLNTEDFDDQLDVKALVIEGEIQAISESDPLGLELLLEEYTKINHADHASSLRRQIELLKEGHFYVRLLSELDILEQKKRKAKQRFWNNRQETERYSYYLETRQHVDDLYQNLEMLEMNLSLSCLSSGPFDPKWVDQLQEWEEAFFGLKMEVYSRLHPKDNYCHLAVYGPEPLLPLDFYLHLFQQKEYLVQSNSLWFRESHYSEAISTLDPGDGNLHKQKREEYIKKPYHPEHANSLHPPQEGDVLWGVEFSVSGPCAYLFLKDEAGPQRWKEPGPEPQQQHYVIVVENQAFRTPMKLHRKDFYSRQPPRRIIEPTFVKDTVYKINREYNKSALYPLIMEKMEERFRIQLDTEIL